MKTLLLLITLFAFLQSAFLPVNLVLSLIIARSLVTDDRSNLYLAFFAGLILSFLMQVNLGYYPVLLILLVKAASLIKRLPVSFNLLMVIGAVTVLIGFGEGLNMLLIGQQFSLQRIIFEIIAAAAFYYLILFWEDRFVASKNTKLRLNSR